MTGDRETLAAGLVSLTDSLTRAVIVFTRSAECPGQQQAQKTTTRDFTCSVSEFTSPTGSIHVFPYVNSPDSVNKFGMSTP